MTPEQCAAVMMRIVTEPQFGDGNIVEAMLAGTWEEPTVNVREVPIENLYPDVGGLGVSNHLVDEEINLINHVRDHGMREPYVPRSARK